MAGTGGRVTASAAQDPGSEYDQCERCGADLDPFNPFPHSCD